MGTVNQTNTSATTHSHLASAVNVLRGSFGPCDSGLGAEAGGASGTADAKGLDLLQWENLNLKLQQPTP